MAQNGGSKEVRGMEVEVERVGTEDCNRVHAPIPCLTNGCNDPHQCSTPFVCGIFRIWWDCNGVPAQISCLAKRFNDPQKN